MRYKLDIVRDLSMVASAAFPEQQKAANMFTSPQCGVTTDSVSEPMNFSTCIQLLP